MANRETLQNVLNYKKAKIIDQEVKKGTTVKLGGELNSAGGVELNSSSKDEEVLNKEAKTKLTVDVIPMGWFPG